MQNDPFNDVPTGIDYLNQIAAPPPKAGFDRKTTIIIAIMAAIGVLSLLFIFIATQNSNPAPTLKNLAAKLQKMQVITDTYNPNLRSTQLQQASSSLRAVLRTANASIGDPLASQGVDPKKQAKEITALDSPGELDKKLSDAIELP